MRINSPSIPFPLFLFGLTIVMAGCTTAPADQSDPAGWEGPRTTRLALALPILFTDVGTGTDVFVHKVMLDDCRWDSHPFASYRLFDHSGVVSGGLLPIDVNTRNETLPIPVSGEGPWILAGQRNPCMSPDTFLSNAIGAQAMSPNHGFTGFDYNDAERFDTVRLVLEPGETEARVRFLPNETTVHAQAGWPEFSQGRATFRGEVRVDYADGEQWAKHSYAANGGYDADFEPIQFFPDGYDVTIRSTIPTPTRVEVVFHFQMFDLYGLTCDLGFDWPECV